MDIAAPVVTALSSADEATRAIIKQVVAVALEQQWEDGQIHLPFGSLVLSAEKG